MVAVAAVDVAARPPGGRQRKALGSLDTCFQVPSHLFGEAMTDLLKNFHSQIQESSDSKMLGVLRNNKKQALLQAMENGLHKMESPLQRMEHTLHGWVSFTIVPLFALANAGIPIDFDRLGEILLHPVTIGVMAGLLLGKVVGIFSFSWLVIKLKLGDLPQGVTMPQILGIGLLAGIGFTMSDNCLPPTMKRMRG